MIRQARDERARMCVACEMQPAAKSWRRTKVSAAAMVSSPRRRLMAMPKSKK